MPIKWNVKYSYPFVNSQVNFCIATVLKLPLQSILEYKPPANHFRANEGRIFRWLKMVWSLDEIQKANRLMQFTKVVIYQNPYKLRKATLERAVLNFIFGITFKWTNKQIHFVVWLHHAKCWTLYDFGIRKNLSCSIAQLQYIFWAICVGFA